MTSRTREWLLTLWPLRSPALALGLPSLLLLAWMVLPLALGSRTLVVRDILHVHLTFKQGEARALRSGYVPVIDPYDGGGEPLLGNPNAVPLYPDNLLYLVAPVLWAFNAHFWLHLLLAPLAAYWMGRAWGLSRGASWAVGVTYATSGFFLSQLNFYNLVAGAALAPAFVAAVLTVGRRPRLGATSAGLLWALLLLAGGPLTVVLAALLAGTALLARDGWRLGGRRAVGLLALAVGLGTLVALPQIVEFVRILPTAARRLIGIAPASQALMWAWHPIRVLEWLIPIPFGRYDLGGPGRFWGLLYYRAQEPFFLSLYPGLLALALVVASGVPRSRAARWAWVNVTLGLLLALGGWIPLGRWLVALPVADLFRFPVKFWLLVAVGASLVCGVGFEQALGGKRPGFRSFVLALALLVTLLTAVFAGLLFFPGLFDAWVNHAAQGGWMAGLVAAERGRWIVTLGSSIILGLVLLVLSSAARRRAVLAAGLLLTAHTAGQLVFLRSLVLTDTTSFYRSKPELADALPPGARVAHFGYDHIINDPPPSSWIRGRRVSSIRQWHLELRPFTGVAYGFRYELDPTSEGLGSYLVQFARNVVRSAGDAERVRALARWGIDAVITSQPLAGVSPADAREVGRIPGITHPELAYVLPKATSEALFAERTVGTSDPVSAWALFVRPGFDPDREALVPEWAVAKPGPKGGDETPRSDPGGPGDSGGPGKVRVLESAPERFAAEVDTPVPGVLVIQRSYLPVWRAAVDGKSAEVLPTNVYRMGVRVPTGRHRVLLWVDRRPLYASGSASLAGLAGLFLLAVFGGERRRAESVEVEGPPQDV